MTAATLLAKIAPTLTERRYNPGETLGDASAAGDTSGLAPGAGVGVGVGQGGTTSSHWCNWALGTPISARSSVQR